MNFILEVAFQLSFFQSFPFPSRRHAALCRLQGAKPLREPPPHDAKRGKEKEEREQRHQQSHSFRETDRERERERDQ